MLSTETMYILYSSPLNYCLLRAPRLEMLTLDMDADSSLDVRRGDTSMVFPFAIHSGMITARISC